jgi:hypothetical protein
MSGLQDIAAHLHQKTEATTRGAGSGFRGSANDMEKQVIEHMMALEQQVYVLTDVTQALLLKSSQKTMSEDRLKSVERSDGFGSLGESSGSGLSKTWRTGL